MITFVMTATFFAASAHADQGVLLTWQTSSGWWFACGPVQCTSGERTEDDAISLAIHEDSHEIQYYDQYGKCNRYVVSNVWSYENSIEKVQRMAKC